MPPAARARLAPSPAERAWAAAHPAVQVGLSRNFAPFYVFEASAERALRAMADGRADPFIGNQHVVAYLVERRLLANLGLRTSLGSSATPRGPAVRRDLPRLRAILDKAIDWVSVADPSRLASRWLPPGSTPVRLPELPTCSAKGWLP